MTAYKESLMAVSNHGASPPGRQVILMRDGSRHPGEPRKHGVTDEDMLHAYRNPIRVFEFDDLTMLVGADAAGRLVEVGTATAEGLEFIVHAMPAREKFLR